MQEKISDMFAVHIGISVPQEPAHGLRDGYSHMKCKHMTDIINPVQIESDQHLTPV
jgi:hypothetical protein